MNKQFREGAVGALLDEYEKAILALQVVINDISNEELITAVDMDTPDPDCRSIQTILSHVIRSGYAYAVYILKLREFKMDFPKRSLHLSVEEYQKDLNAIFSFTEAAFKNISDIELEHFDNDKKIITSWGESYSIEQITEHAIVHVLRHRRQIEKFKLTLR
ncbi:MAG: DinB family protein [Ferruginibacter sp.]